MSVVVGTLAAGVVLAVAVGEGRTWRPRRTRQQASTSLGARGHSVVATVARRVASGVHPRDPGVATTDMVAFLDAVARSLRSGAGLHTALRGSTRVAGVHTDGLAALVGSLDAGVPLAVALGAWRGSQPSPEVSLAAAVLGFGLASGGSVARAVDGAAATLRERLALSGETRVLATQARASAVVVGGAPVAFTAVVVLADPRVAGVLFGSIPGLLCLVVGVVLEVTCVIWMRRLVARAAQQ